MLSILGSYGPRAWPECHKPCGLLNVEGFYDDLLSFLDHAADERLLPDRLRSVATSYKSLLVERGKTCNNSDAVSLQSHVVSNVNAPNPSVSLCVAVLMTVPAASVVEY